MKVFFLIGSIIAGAAFTIGSSDTAKVLWLLLGLASLAVLWIRKTKPAQKAPVPTEYSEVELRELYTALSVAKSSAPFSRHTPSSNDAD